MRLVPLERKGRLCRSRVRASGGSRTSRQRRARVGGREENAKERAATPDCDRGCAQRRKNHRATMARKRRARYESPHRPATTCSLHRRRPASSRVGSEEERARSWSVRRGIERDRRAHSRRKKRTKSRAGSGGLPSQRRRLRMSKRKRCPSEKRGRVTPAAAGGTNYSLGCPLRADETRRESSNGSSGAAWRQRNVPKTTHCTIAFRGDLSKKRKRSLPTPRARAPARAPRTTRDPK